MLRPLLRFNLNMNTMTRRMHCFIVTLPLTLLSIHILTVSLPLVPANHQSSTCTANTVTLDAGNVKLNWSGIGIAKLDETGMISSGSSSVFAVLKTPEIGLSAGVLSCTVVPKVVTLKSKNIFATRSSSPTFDTYVYVWLMSSVFKAKSCGHVL